MTTDEQIAASLARTSSLAILPNGDSWWLVEMNTKGNAGFHCLSTHAKLFDAAKELLHVAAQHEQYASQVAGVSL